jgi:hypothetical protein
MGDSQAIGARICIDARCAPGDDPIVKWIAALIAAVALSLPAPSRADEVEITSDPVRVYLLTLGPGADPWEKFGHDFIDIEDASRSYVDRTDPTKTFPYRKCYNWGVFDFGAGIIPFGWHFVQGKLLYSMQGWPTDEQIELSIKEGRTITKQELHFTAEQKQDLIERLRVNDTDANRYYRYDYFVKNCSTMARDAIDATVGGQVKKTLTQIPTTTTLRWHDRRLTADTLWLYFFLDYALGHGVDQPLNAWQESFLPEKLGDHLQQVMVPGPDGKLIPLADKPVVINTGIYSERLVPPNYFWGFLATGVILAGVFVGLGNFAGRTRWARYPFKLLAMVWSLLAGVLGGLMCFAWFTDHEAAKWNENIVQLSVVSLLLVVLIPLSRWWPNAVRKTAVIVLFLAVIGLLVKVLPWFNQTNGQIIAAVLPVHAAIAWGVYQLPHKRVRPATDEAVAA